MSSPAAPGGGTATPPSSTPPAPVSPDPSMEGTGVLGVKITSARFVSTWRWDVTSDPEDVCGICRSAFEACCPTCKVPGDDCPPMLGGCKHAFHMHCIMTWLAAKDKEQVCPLCRRPWDS